MNDETTTTATAATASSATRTTRRPLVALASFAFLLTLAATPNPVRARQNPAHDGLAKSGDDGGGGGGGHDTLKLRLNDAVGKPGGMVALVVRTYAARPLRQGRITVRVRKPPAKALGFGFEELTQPARPLTFVRGVVFSAAGDAVTTATATYAADSQSVGLQFSSRAAAVNAADGPLAVLFMRLDKAVAPGSVFALEIDPAATGLVDPAGAAVSIEPIHAELRVRAAKAPYALEAEGDEVAPGEVAEMGVETAEPFAVFGGRVTLRWNAAAQGGPPQVSMDPRYGKGTFRVERSVPGELVVSFSSPKGTLNSVPGAFLGVALPTSASAPIGSSSQVTIDRAGSWLLDKRGRKLALSLEAGSLDFE